MTTRQTVLAAALPLALLSTSAMADLSTTVTLASDYTFNGVSQTQNDPAIQGSLDYAFADSGMYVGTALYDSTRLPIWGKWAGGGQGCKR